jgi:hypothetical protein
VDTIQTAEAIYSANDEFKNSLRQRQRERENEIGRMCIRYRVLII